MTYKEDSYEMYAQLKLLLANSRKVSVLVVGDLILDEYLFGKTDRISPEAPVAVLAWNSQNYALGGAANVANNLVSLGCEAFLAGIVGKDQGRDELHKLARAAEIHTEGIIADSKRPTTIKTRIVSHSQHLLRIDKEITVPISQAQERAILAYAKKMISHVDGVILSDYAKGVLTPDLCQALIQVASLQGLPVLVDPKGDDFSKYRHAALLSPNKNEVRNAAHMPVQTEAQLEAAVEYLFSVVNCSALLVTRGQEGMSLYKPRSPNVRIETQATEVFDITGAGDTAMAMLGRVLFAGNDMLSAARLANIAAGIKIEKLGTAAVETKEVLHWLLHEEYEPNRKIVDQHQLKQVVGRARSLNKKIAFTNGCFDLLHVGHIHMLQSAKAIGDLLIVAINDDDSVRKLKGDGRPLVTAADRARIISSLEAVDYVVIFSDPAPLRLIEELKPDILVKGSNYALSEVVGREQVERYGGRVELVPLVESQSTSEFIQSVTLRLRGFSTSSH